MWRRGNVAVRRANAGVQRLGNVGRPLKSTLRHVARSCPFVPALALAIGNFPLLLTGRRSYSLVQSLLKS